LSAGLGVELGDEGFEVFDFLAAETDVVHGASSLCDPSPGGKP
jgi:hypothetical protein